MRNDRELIFRKRCHILGGQESWTFEYNATIKKLMCENVCKKGSGKDAIQQRANYNCVM